MLSVLNTLLQKARALFSCPENRAHIYICNMDQETVVNQFRAFLPKDHRIISIDRIDTYAIDLGARSLSFGTKNLFRVLIEGPLLFSNSDVHPISEVGIVVRLETNDELDSAKYSLYGYWSTYINCKTFVSQKWKIGDYSIKPKLPILDHIVDLQVDLNRLSTTDQPQALIKPHQSGNG